MTNQTAHITRVFAYDNGTWERQTFTGKFVRVAHKSIVIDSGYVCTGVVKTMRGKITTTYTLTND